MFARRLALLPPRELPWPLKSLDNARTSLTYDEHGRMVMRIAHDLIRNVTPRDVAWWFGNIAGTIDIDGCRQDRYLVWHPFDHIQWSLVRPGLGGGATVGAQFHIVEAFGRNPDHYVDVVEQVVRLDETGFTGVSSTLGLRISCLQHEFSEVAGRTNYDSTLTIGFDIAGISKALNPIVQWLKFPEAMGRAWLKHNVEEVGLLEHIIPLLLSNQNNC